MNHDPLPVWVADGLLLEQVLQNLIGNAIKFQGTEPPRIHVATQRKERAWQFSVRDNGIGIEPQYAQRCS